VKPRLQFPRRDDGISPGSNMIPPGGIARKRIRTRNPFVRPGRKRKSRRAAKDANRLDRARQRSRDRDSIMPNVELRTKNAKNAHNPQITAYHLLDP
jgi:hypothetical protein